MKRLLLFLSAIALTACSKPSTSAHSTDTDSGIVGGTDATITMTDIKPVVMIYNTKRSSLCTGTLIGEDTVLTAAHCVVEAQKSPSDRALIMQDVKDMRIVFGLSPFKALNSILRPVISTISHEKYSNVGSSADRYDIALIRFTGGRPPGTEIAALPSGHPSDVIVPFRALGYGRSNGLLNKPTETNPTGAGVLRFVDLRAYFLFDHDREFVVDQTEGSGICLGDSGGPALVKSENGKLIVIGVVSRVFAAGVNDQESKKEPNFDMCAHSSIYTSISGFTDWVQNANTKLHSK